MIFKQRVLKVVAKIPAGHVATYGKVAALCGFPRAARQVGWVLRGLGNENIPWWRVVNSQGEISIKGNVYASKWQQRELLVREGIKVNKNFKIDLKIYLWKKNYRPAK